MSRTLSVLSGAGTRHGGQGVASARTAMFAAIVVTIVPSRRTLKTPVTTHYLIHHRQDTVGVAVAEGIETQQELTGWLMDGDKTVTVRARDPIPLGHKIALAEIADGLETAARNVHFDDQVVGGDLRYDYRLKPGPVTRGNALAIMRAVGLDVPQGAAPKAPVRN